MEEYWLMPLVGFLMDTTLAAAHLVFAGDSRALSAHHLGAVPHGRRDPVPRRAPRPRLRGVCATAGATSTEPPSAYLKQFYYDTVNFDPDCIELAIEFAGADHILAGSDYPHQIGSIPKMLEALGRAGRDRRATDGR